MSLFNMLMGRDEFAPLLISLLFSRKEQVPPRVRDCYLFEVEGELRICILTRQGGPNRLDFGDSNGELQRHPLYVRDYDEESDTTYATFEFRLPPGGPPDVLEAMRKVMLRTETPMQRLANLVERMGNKAHESDPDVQRAFEKGKELLGPVIEKIMNQPGGTTAALIDSEEKGGGVNIVPVEDL